MPELCVRGGEMRWLGSGSSCALAHQSVADRIEVHQRSCPFGLEPRFLAADVPTFPRSIAVCEQAEEPLDPWAGSAQVLRRGGVSERVAAGDQKLLVLDQPDLPLRPCRAARSLQRTAAAERLAETRTTNPVCPGR